MPFWKTAALVIVLTLLTAGIHAIEPLIQKQIFDALAGQVSIFQDMTSLKFISLAVLALVSLVLLSEAVTFTATYLSWKLRLKTNYKLLDAVVSRIYELSLSYHQRETIASLRTRIDRGINGFCSVLFDISFSILPSVLYLACTIVFMFMLSWKLSLVALFFAPLPAIIGIFAGKIASEREKVLMKRWIEIFSRFHETLSLIKVVKSFAREDAERNKFLGEVDKANQIVSRGVAVDSMLGSGKNISMAFGRIAVLGFGAYLIMQGEITIGTLVAFLSYVGGLSMPVIGLAGVYEAYRKARVYIELIFEVIDTPKEVEDSPDAVEMPRPAGAVTFENVHFAYRPDRPILQG